MYLNKNLFQGINMQYDYDLYIQLENGVDLYQQNREKFRENSSPDDRIFFERSERFAQLIRNNTEEIVSKDKVDDDLKTLQYEFDKINSYKKREAFDLMCKSGCSVEEIDTWVREIISETPEDPENEESPLKLVWEKLCIDYAWDLVGEIRGCAERTLKLNMLILATDPGTPTLSFLRRLSRCYIWGFDPECVILCRSVIDTAFKDTITDSLCEKYYTKRKPEDDFGLANRIVTAKKEKIITSDISKLAFLVKDRGDKAVHAQPDVTKDVLGTIANTIRVIDCLFSSGYG
jgi:hypothetical protein